MFFTIWSSVLLFSGQDARYFTSLSQIMPPSFTESEYFLLTKFCYQVPQIICFAPNCPFCNLVHGPFFMLDNVLTSLSWNYATWMHSLVDHWLYAMCFFCSVDNMLSSMSFFTRKFWWYFVSIDISGCIVEAVQ